MSLQEFLKQRESLTKCLYARKMPNGFIVPCGHCSHCRKSYAREMAFRVEAEAYDKYVYNVLLTYDDEHLPRIDGRPVLNRVHVQDFLKRFRTWHDKYTGTKLRFFGVGEYGGKKGRPHYHVIFFTDKPLEIPQEDKHEPLSFINGVLNDKWRKGACDIEPMTNAGGAVKYLVQYLLTYDKKDKETLVKPFRMMSRGRGLGYNWLERTRPFQKWSVENNDYTFTHTNDNGVTITVPVPRYYKRKYVPEEIQIAQADEFYFKCQEFDELHKHLTPYEQYEIAKEIKQLQEREQLYQQRIYRERKVHENNRSAHRVFARVAKTRLG